MADTLPTVKGDVTRADIALKEQLNRYFGNRDISEAVYHNRHELFILLTDWSTRIEQGIVGMERQDNNLNDYIQEG